ncbi:RNA-directed DNA polymerase, eukaryota, reverse transcriptase zinc-binding domain protein [Tanacetum coccineum]
MSKGKLHEFCQKSGSNLPAYLDGPFILNEIIHWCKAKKKQTMIFKVDFEKAFDSVRWDFLDDVLKKFGFGSRWGDWIQSCLKSSKGSILVNGSPTSEFQFFKGLKQGDPLSPFLFILVMESLHLSFQKVANAGLFKGVAIDNSLQLSHLFYADDVVFIGQWCDSNISTIIRVLDCFFRASVNIGGHLSRINSWDVVINKILGRLSKWKLKVLSVGGRLTLLKSVLGSTPIYYMSMFKAHVHVINKLEAIRSHFFNEVDLKVRKMTFVKWENVLTSKESRVIKALHEEDGKLGYPIKSSFSSNWIDIVRTLPILFKKGIDLLDYIKKKVGNGKNTKFWYEPWKGDVSFKNLFPRLFALELDKKITVARKMAHPSLGTSFRRNPRSGTEQSQMAMLVSHLEGIRLPNMLDRWSWSLSGDGEFSVSSTRNLIDDKTLGTVGSKTQWWSIFNRHVCSNGRWGKPSGNVGDTGVATMPKSNKKNGDGDGDDAIMRLGTDCGKASLGGRTNGSAGCVTGSNTLRLNEDCGVKICVKYLEHVEHASFMSLNLTESTWRCELLEIATMAKIWFIGYFKPCDSSSPIEMKKMNGGEAFIFNFGSMTETEERSEEMSLPLYNALVIDVYQQMPTIPGDHVITNTSKWKWDTAFDSSSAVTYSPDDQLRVKNKQHVNQCVTCKDICGLNTRVNNAEFGPIRAPNERQQQQRLL